MKVLFLMTLLLVLSHCSKNQPTGSPPSEVSGTWVQACNPAGSDPLTLKFIFTETGYEHHTLIYTAGCGTLLGTLKQTGTYTLSGAVATPAETKAIDLKQSALTITAAPGQAANLTAAVPCTGVTYAETPVDMSGADCDGAGSDAPLLSDGQTFYGIYRLPGDDSFRFSNQEHPTSYRTSGQGNAADNRPTSLQTLYVKQ